MGITCSGMRFQLSRVYTSIAFLFRWPFAENVYTYIWISSEFIMRRRHQTISFSRRNHESAGATDMRLMPSLVQLCFPLYSEDFFIGKKCVRTCVPHTKPKISGKPFWMPVCNANVYRIMAYAKLKLRRISDFCFLHPFNFDSISCFDNSSRYPYA